MFLAHFFKMQKLLSKNNYLKIAMRMMIQDLFSFVVMNITCVLIVKLN